MKGFLIMFEDAALAELKARKAHGDVRSIGGFVREAVRLHVERQRWGTAPMLQTMGHEAPVEMSDLAQVAVTPRPLDISEIGQEAMERSTVDKAPGDENLFG